LVLRFCRTTKWVLWEKCFWVDDCWNFSCEKLLGILSLIPVVG